MHNDFPKNVISIFPRNTSFPPRRGDSQRVLFIAESTLKCGLGTSIFYFDKRKTFSYNKLEFYPLPGRVTADPSKSTKFSFISAIKDLAYFSITIIMFKSKLTKKSVLYAHTPIGGLVGSVIKLFTGQPLIYDPHDWFYEDWVFYHRNLSTIKRVTISIFFRILSVILETFSDVIICVSTEMMNAVKTRHLKILIPNCARRIPEGNHSNESNITDENKQSIIFVGHIAVYQGILLLLKAFKIVEQKNQDVQLIIVGAGEDLKLTKQLAKRYKLKDVIFTGSLSQKKVYSHIRKSSLCVAPFLSLPFVKTSCPIKLLEYAALDKKIVTTDIPAFRRILAGYNKVYFSGETPESLSQTIMYALKQTDFIQSVNNNITWNKNYIQKIICKLYKHFQLKNI